MNQQIHDSIRKDQQAMVDLTRDLIRIPSENPPGKSYGDVLDVLSRALKDLGFEPEVHGECLLAFTGERDRVLYFSGHYDVVPAQHPKQFEPDVEGNNLFGRGSSDMKSGLAAMIYAAKAVRDCGAKLNGGIGLVFVPDEETAGPRGSRFLESKGLLGQNAVGMLTPEPTGGVIWNANRGAITLKIKINGKAAHVGHQFEGINAFEGMMGLAQELAELKKEVEERVTGYEIQPEKAKHSILLLGGQSGGGTNFNVVPESCWFTVDRRINPEENFQAEKERLLSLLSRERQGCKVEIEILQEGASAATPAITPLGMALAKNVASVTGSTPRFEMCPGLLETRFYAARGMPAYAYGPGLLTVSHGPNEFVPIPRIANCAVIYALTAIDFLV
ncbi:MAG TPA: ArgE/DapE family deacylase [Candidatus Angelobacter sp.]